VGRPDLVVVQEGDPIVDGGYRVVPAEDLTTEGRASGALPAAREPAVVQFTSGSTSDPRAIVLSHRAIVMQVFGLADRVARDDPSRDHMFSWLPLYHDLGFIACLVRSMVLGTPVTFLPTDLFLADPARWIIEMSRRRTTISAAPNFAFGLVARQIERGLSEPVDLSSLKVVANGGEANDPRTVARFLEAAVPLGFDPGALLPGYGLAESTCVVTVPPPGAGARMDHVSRAEVAKGVALPAPEGETSAGFVSVGPPIAGTEIKIVGDDGSTLDDRRIGEIHTRGPCLMEGYLEDEEATRAAVSDGWLRTGDLGYLSGGELFVTGRLKDLIIIRGQNYYAEDIERIVQSVDGVRPGACVAFGASAGATETLVIAAETKLEDPDDLAACSRAIKRQIWSSTGLSPSDIVLLPPGAVPKTSSGKLQRNVARQLYSEGVAQQVALAVGAEG
ncbi:MAG TPA: AMP-binding protein, partial [Actinomycetota bacterium]|nr:AMP-binding protein [Actinomycetota bacterium]